MFRRALPAFAFAASFTLASACATVPKGPVGTVVFDVRPELNLPPGFTPYVTLFAVNLTTKDEVTFEVIDGLHRQSSFQLPAGTYRFTDAVIEVPPHDKGQFEYSGIELSMARQARKLASFKVEAGRVERYGAPLRVMMGVVPVNDQSGDLRGWATIQPIQALTSIPKSDE